MPVTSTMPAISLEKSFENWQACRRTDIVFFIHLAIFLPCPMDLCFSLSNLSKLGLAA